MDLTSLKQIKELLAKYGAKPSRGLGQNFLIDRNILSKIIDSADLKPTNTVLEIGPGIGTLTRELAQKAGKVIAVEKDVKMIEILKETLKEYTNIEIINNDILKIPNPKLQSPTKSQIPNSKHKVVANIPYYITALLIRKFLETDNQPELMVLMLQKEVAQRICAKPPDMSLLSVSAQFYAEPKIVSYVSKNCFMPAPKVDSAIIKIHPIKYREAVILPKAKLFNRVNPEASTSYKISPELFFKIVKAGFSHPRKQLAGNLSKALKLTKEQTTNWLLKNNIQPNQRAETLSISDWKNLTVNSSCE